MPDPVFSTLHLSAHVIITKPSTWDKYKFHPYFIDVITEEGTERLSHTAYKNSAVWF